MKKLGAGGDIPDRGNSMKRGIEERIISIHLETHKPSRVVERLCVYAVTEGQSPPYRRQQFSDIGQQAAQGWDPCKKGSS